MNLLLDTHSLLWALTAPGQLPLNVQSQLKDSRNTVFVSAVSLWEISIKSSLGKLTLSGIPIDEILLYCKKSGFSVLPLTGEDASSFSILEMRPDHRDPFDRMLVHLSIKHDVTLVSKDRRMQMYVPAGLTLVWD